MNPESGTPDPVPGSLDAELGRSVAAPRWQRQPVSTGGSLRVGLLAGVVASIVAGSLAFDANTAVHRGALITAGLLLVVGWGLALPRATRKTGLGVVAGFAFGVVGVGIAALLGAVGDLASWNYFIF
jgi:hypothetical protein